jgi:hypothetical protein
LPQAARKAPEPSALALTPGRIAALVRESGWLLLVAAVVYLAMVLFTYDRADPGWSHSAQVAEVRNAGGVAGAWIADLLLWLFGMSAWWWVALCLHLTWQTYRGIDRRREASAVAPSSPCPASCSCWWAARRSRRCASTALTPNCRWPLAAWSASRSARPSPRRWGSPARR